ncbi:DUF1249 domain-containing protein [bacterium]|nr:DUF1249 domain-containing protein [bacterium]
MIGDWGGKYLRFTKMLAEMGERDVREIQVAGRGVRFTVRFSIKERSPYTTTVAIDIQHPQLESADKALTVRLYHDAKMAEVTTPHGRQYAPRYDYPNPQMHQRDEKAQQNRFLSEYLSQCLRYGLDAAAPAALRFA